MNLSKISAFLTPAFLETFLASLLIILLPTQLGKHFWPSFSYIYSLKIDYLAVTVYMWDLLVYLLLVICLFKHPKINNKALGFLSLFLISAGFSLVFSSNWLVGISRLANFVPAGLFGLYLASKGGVYVKKIITRYLPYAVLGTAVLAFLQFITGGTVGLWILGERSFDLSTQGIATFNWYGQVFLRVYATFSHPNVLAAFMLLSGLLLLFLSGIRSYFEILTQIAVIGTVIFSFSRASIAVLAVLVFFILRKQIVFLILFSMLISPLLYVRFDSAFNFDQVSVTRREELAETAWAITQKSPFFGVGLNNYIPTAATSAFLSGTNRFLQPVHNIFLLTLSETGFFGLVGFLMFFLSPLFFCSSNNLLKRSQIVAFLLIISFLGMIDHYFLTLPQGQRMFFLLWGISWTKK